MNSKNPREIAGQIVDVLESDPKSNSGIPFERSKKFLKKYYMTKKEMLFDDFNGINVKVPKMNISNFEYPESYEKSLELMKENPNKNFVINEIKGNLYVSKEKEIPQNSNNLNNSKIKIKQVNETIEELLNMKNSVESKDLYPEYSNESLMKQLKLYKVEGREQLTNKNQRGKLLEIKKIKFPEKIKCKK